MQTTTQLLTESELVRKQLYDLAWLAKTRSSPLVNPDLVYNLTDNPEVRLSWTTSNLAIPTYRTNTNFLWYPAFNRHLSRRERLATLGFPVFPPLAVAAGSSHILGKDLKETQTMVGNSMHLANATCVVAACLASTVMVE
eukprot:4487002-Karenia_brevis.AAC.1